MYSTSAMMRAILGDDPPGHPRGFVRHAVVVIDSRHGERVRHTGVVPLPIDQPAASWLFGSPEIACERFPALREESMKGGVRFL